MVNYPLPPGASFYPQYLPYPEAIPAVSNYPVPNATAINTPQGQFAPPYLPPGSRSFQPFNYAVGAQTKVLYGAGSPFDTKTPLGEYAGDDGDCACPDAGSETLSPWAYVAIGAGIALIMKHFYDQAGKDPGIYD